MPTDLSLAPGVRTERVPLRHLTLRESLVFWILLARMRWINARMEKLAQRMGNEPAPPDAARLIRGAYAWMWCHAHLSALLGYLEPPEAIGLLDALFGTFPSGACLNAWGLVGKPSNGQAGPPADPITID